MDFIAYDDWSYYADGATPSSHPIGSTKGITAHWEGPKMGGFPHAKCAQKVRVIQRFHRINRGWADIAYNAVVCPHGTVFEGRGANVRSAANGWSDVNDDWYAVCYLGGQGDGFTEAGKKGFVAAFKWLRTKGNAGPALNGHRDHKATACPGDAIYRWVHDEAHNLLTEDDDMAAEDVWEHRVNEYDKSSKAEKRAARVLLAQAHNRAGDARKAASQANRRAKAAIDAVEALAEALGVTAEYEKAKARRG